MSNPEKENSRFALAHFCDDIRVEASGKLTLVGVYNADMLFQEFPAFVPKLAVWLFVSSPIGETINTIAVKISKADSVIMEFAPTTIQKMTPMRDAAHDAPSRMTFTLNIGLPPMTLSEACTVRVDVAVDGTDYCAGKLHVGLMPSYAFAPIPNASDASAPDPQESKPRA